MPRLQNYLVKLYEFLDTVILILKNKPVIFLHEYHHAATLFLCWIQMEEHSACQWVPITINLFVHIFMYYVSIHPIVDRRVQRIKAPYSFRERKRERKREVSLLV